MWIVIGQGSSTVVVEVSNLPKVGDKIEVTPDNLRGGTSKAITQVGKIHRVLLETAPYPVGAVHLPAFDTEII